MDNSQPLAITAIADGVQESFIASLLARLGYQIIHRATSLNGLADLMQANPKVLLVASDDFRDISELAGEELLLIRGKSAGVGARSLINPRNEAEFSELLSSRRSNVGSELIRPVRSSAQVTLCYAIGNSYGATSTAINIAHELAHQGERVLIIDANFSHPDLSERFQLNALYKKEQVSQFGFSICEINSFQSLETFANLSNSFTHVLVDCGRFQERFLNPAGRRCEDFLHFWAVQSAANVFLLAGDSGVDRALKAHRAIAAINKAIESWLIISLESAMGSRDREKYSSRISLESGLPTHLFSRDYRAIEKLERERSTILATSPRSALRGEISDLALRLLKG